MGTPGVQLDFTALDWSRCVDLLLPVRIYVKLSTLNLVKTPSFCDSKEQGTKKNLQNWFTAGSSKSVNVVSIQYIFGRACFYRGNSKVFGFVWDVSLFLLFLFQGSSSASNCFCLECIVRFFLAAVFMNCEIATQCCDWPLSKALPAVGARFISLLRFSSGRQRLIPVQLAFLLARFRRSAQVDSLRHTASQRAILFVLPLLHTSAKVLFNVTQSPRESHTLHFRMNRDCKNRLFHPPEESQGFLPGLAHTKLSNLKAVYFGMVMFFPQRVSANLGGKTYLYSCLLLDEVSVNGNNKSMKTKLPWAFVLWFAFCENQALSGDVLRVIDWESFNFESTWRHDNGNKRTWEQNHSSSLGYPETFWCPWSCEIWACISRQNKCLMWTLPWDLERDSQTKTSDVPVSSAELGKTLRANF